MLPVNWKTENLNILLRNLLFPYENKFEEAMQ